MSIADWLHVVERSNGGCLGQHDSPDSQRQPGPEIGRDISGWQRSQVGARLLVRLAARQKTQPTSGVSAADGGVVAATERHCRTWISGLVAPVAVVSVSLPVIDEILSKYAARDGVENGCDTVVRASGLEWYVETAGAQHVRRLRSHGCDARDRACECTCER